MTPDPVTTPGIVADLLATAAEAEDPELLPRTHALLVDLLGREVVLAGHREWTTQLMEGLAAPSPDHTEPPAPGDDVFDLTARLRADTSKHRRRARP